MKTRKKRSGLFAGLLAAVLMVGAFPFTELHVQASPADAGEGQSQAITEVAPEPGTYTVMIDLDGGTLEGLERDGWSLSGEEWSRTLTEEKTGEGARLTLGTPDRSGFRFAGWQPDGESETFPALTDYVVQQDAHFTALWEENEADPEATPAVTDLSGDLPGSDPDGAGNPDGSGEAGKTPPENSPSASVLNNDQAWTVDVSLGGGSWPEDWNPGEGWVLEEGVWHYTPAAGETDQVTFRLGTPTRGDETFKEWKILSPEEGGSVSVKQDDKGAYLALSAQNATAVKLQAQWNILYDIKFDGAEYKQKFDGVTKNTVNFSQVNSEYPLMMDKLLEFLNANVSQLKLDYTVTYLDMEGVQQTVKRSGVPLDLEWRWQDDGWQDGQNPASTADFRDIVNTQLKAMDGTTSMVRLNDAYLKGLIADYEQTVTQDALPGAQDLEEENIRFSDWGTWVEAEQTYKNGDADTLALSIKIGVPENKTTGISDNEAYMIDTVSPSNVTLNLFDYWLLAQGYYDQHTDGPADVFYNTGINKEHGLLFKKNNVSGEWNNWTGQKSDVRRGIVKKLLNENGYPELNLKAQFKASGQWAAGSQTISYNPEETLAYLFDPDALTASGNGVGYSDVKGLFKVDESGNYYYSSHDNFAEFNKKENAFNVYNTWGVKNHGTSPAGQFYPFNTADQVFKIGTDGTLAQNGIDAVNPLVNHYLGLTMEAEFQQPVDGMVSVGANAKPMVFEFSGDDDVWIFIDGVLVADLGGIHDEATVKIDFSTGEVLTYLAADSSRNRKSTTLKAQFEAAGVSTDGFNKDTFGNNTTHTLKMFYLERGNTDSNLTLSFTLMEPADNTLIKLDQDGKPMAGVTFQMYPAKLDDNGEYVRDGENIGENLVTGPDGTVAFPNYDFSQHDYYILEEKVPNGYFSPEKVVLRYDRFTKHSDGQTSGTNLLMVENRWTTGAVSNFSASVHQAGTLKYNTGQAIDQETGAKGLILAVPLLLGSDDEWHPLYGSNMVGFHNVEDWAGGDDEQNQRRAILEAALYQIYGAQYQEDLYGYGFPEWYLEWNEENDRFEGTLVDLPGEATRYYWASNSPDADLTVAYYFLDLDALQNVFGDLTGKDSAQKLAAIAEKIGSGTADVTSEEVKEAVRALVERIDNDDTKGFALLDVSDFNRVFSSRIYVPNVSPELRVLKLDEKGNPLEGAEFALYKSEQQPTGTAKPCATGTTDKQGLLVFSNAGTGAEGSAFVNFEPGTYWLKETNPPAGYTGNEKIVPVFVTENGRIYADALEKDDGITVRKGLGKLLETMVRYAAKDSVNVTLQDITATLVTGNTWDDVKAAIAASGADPSAESLNLHYGLNNALLEYGTHEVNGITPNPYFEVDENIPGIRVEQNYQAHENDILYSTTAIKTNLEDTNIRNLFTGSTTIVVRNRKEGSQGSFSVTKTVSGSAAPENAAFLFDVTITGKDKDGNAWQGASVPYEVTDTADDRVLETGTLTFAPTGQGTEEYRITNVTPGTVTTSQYIVKENDTWRLQLQNGQKISVDKIPFGLYVKVTETEDSAAGYITSVTVNDGKSVEDTEAGGVVVETVGDPSFHFYNHKDKSADLTLEKTLPEESGSTQKFPFTIHLWAQESGDFLTQTYTYRITNNGNLVDSGTITDGQLQVELGDQDKLVIENLPVGSQYTIKETTKGYAPTVTINGQAVEVKDGTVTGTVEKETTQEPTPNAVAYANVRSGSITITKRSGGGDAAQRRRVHPVHSGCAE